MNKKLSAGQILLYLIIAIAVIGYMISRTSDNQESESTQSTETKKTTNSEQKSGTKSTPTAKATEKPKDDVTINEQVIYEGHDIIIKATGTELDWLGDKAIKIYCENNSTKNLRLCANAYAVNGIMSQNNMFDLGMEIAAGKKAVGSFSIDSNFLTENGIETIKNIDVLFWAYDTDKSFKDFETEIVRISTTKDDGSYTVHKGTRIYSKDGVSVDVFPTSDTKNVEFVITNEAKTYIECSLDAVSINDFTGDSLSYALVAEKIFSGCQCGFTIQAKDDFLKDCGISQVEKIEFRIYVEIEGDYSNRFFTDMMEYQVGK